MDGKQTKPCEIKDFPRNLACRNEFSGGIALDQGNFF